MTCNEARRLLLEAEVAELEGSVDSPLSRHLQGCSACAGAAAAILNANSELNAFLRAQVDGDAVKRVLAQAGSAEAPSRSDTPGFGARWAPSAWATLAMAAAVAGLLLLARPAPPPIGELPPVATAAERPLVEEAAGSTVAIIQTDNPDITVLWFF